LDIEAPKAKKKKYSFLLEIRFGSTRKLVENLKVDEFCF